MLDIEKLKEIKRTAIIALFSDDDLMDSLVLKGGECSRHSLWHRTASVT